MWQPNEWRIDEWLETREPHLEILLSVVVMLLLALDIDLYCKSTLWVQSVGGEITHRFKCQSEKGCRWMWVLWMTHKGCPSSGVCLGKGQSGMNHESPIQERLNVGVWLAIGAILQQYRCHIHSREYMPTTLMESEWVGGRMKEGRKGLFTDKTIHCLVFIFLLLLIQSLHPRCRRILLKTTHWLRGIQNHANIIQEQYIRPLSRGWTIYGGYFACGCIVRDSFYYYCYYADGNRISHGWRRDLSAFCIFHKLWECVKLRHKSPYEDKLEVIICSHPVSVVDAINCCFLRWNVPVSFTIKLCKQ